MNPKLKKFLEDNPDMSILGFAWALYWRLALCFLGVYMGAMVLFGMFALISEM